jgi:hypothetical protein
MQAFHNLTIDCPGWTENLNLGWNSGTVTIGGSITVRNTGTGRLNFTAPPVGGSVVVDIAGDLIVDGTALPVGNQVHVTSNGTSNTGTRVTINQYGNIEVRGNAADAASTNFSVSRGSQGISGMTLWKLYGDFRMFDASTQNSTTIFNYARFIFLKQGTQYLEWRNVVQVTPYKTYMEIGAGSTVVLDAPLNMAGRLGFAGGMLVPTSANPLIMGYWTGTLLYVGIVRGTGSASFVNGPMAYLWDEAGPVSFTYPIGKDASYRPVTLTLTQDAAAIIQYTAEMFNTAPPARSLPPDCHMVSGVRYYTITRSGGTGVTDPVVQLSYGADDSVADPALLRIARTTAPATG